MPALAPVEIPFEIGAEVSPMLEIMVAELGDWLVLESVELELDIDS